MIADSECDTLMSDGMKIDYSGRELVEVLLKRHQIGIIREEDSLYGECLNELKAALTQRSILPLGGRRFKAMALLSAPCHPSHEADTRCHMGGFKRSPERANNARTHKIRP